MTERMGHLLFFCEQLYITCSFIRGINSTLTEFEISHSCDKISNVAGRRGHPLSHSRLTGSLCNCVFGESIGSCDNEYRGLTVMDAIARNYDTCQLRMKLEDTVFKRTSLTEFTHQMRSGEFAYSLGRF